MRIPTGIALVVTLLATSTTFAQSPPPVEPVTPEAYQELVESLNYQDYNIGLSTFEKYAKEKGVVVLDLRSKAAFDRYHIKGAKHLGADIDEERIQQLVPSKETPILIYCSNSFKEPTRTLGLTISSLPQFILLGYTKIRYLESAWPDQLTAKDLFTNPEEFLNDQKHGLYQ